MFQLNHCVRIVFEQVPSRYEHSFLWLTKNRDVLKILSYFYFFLTFFMDWSSSTMLISFFFCNIIKLIYSQIIVKDYDYHLKIKPLLTLFDQLIFYFEFVGSIWSFEAGTIISVKLSSIPKYLFSLISLIESCVWYSLFFTINWSSVSAIFYLGWLTSSNYSTNSSTTRPRNCSTNWTRVATIFDLRTFTVSNDSSYITSFPINISFAAAILYCTIIVSNNCSYIIITSKMRVFDN